MGSDLQDAWVGCVTEWLGFPMFSSYPVAVLQDRFGDS